MILKNNLYSIQSQNIGDSKADFRVSLDAEHFIYKAHFPSNPITPGVCLIQMVVELFGTLKNTDYKIDTLKNVKFTAPISPLEFSEIDVAIDFTENQIKAIIKEKNTVFAKMSLILSENLKI
jgi:3-hydroxyacyl-[acyl-carrier-protein] dehydratase